MKKYKNIIRILATAGLLMAAVACQPEVDHSYSRFTSTMVMEATDTEVVLNEDTPDDIALTIKWSAAKDYGDDFIMSYKYEWNLYESTKPAQSEYEDFGIFIREYTHEQLQDMMINEFGYKTSTWGTMQFTVTADYEGPYVVLPEQERIEVKVKTYGPKQFAADKVYLSGTAVGQTDIQVLPSESNASIYVWNGKLGEGKINVPVIYGDEHNVIIPASGEEVEAGLDPMPAAIEEFSEDAPSWIVTAAEDYRVTLNFETKTISIVPIASIMEVDKLYMAGTALAEEVEVKRTLENAAVYAWRGELSAGQVWFPVEFDNERNLTIVPAKQGHDILDGESDTFTSVSSVAAAERYWEIPSDGIYRIVVDTDSKSIRIYSPATDPKPHVTPEWKNTTIPNEATGESFTWVTTSIESLWMWGDFDSEAFRDTPTDKYKIDASLANPYIFVWSGALNTGTVKFQVSNAWNNVWAFGASDVRDQHVTAVLGQQYEMVPGQGNNRYSRYTIPSGTNFILIDITDLEHPTVIFDKK